MRVFGTVAVIIWLALVGGCASGLKVVRDTFPHSCKVKCHDAHPDDLYRRNQCSDACDPPSN